MSRELVGDSSNQAVYPITSVSGVFDENNKDLKTILTDLKKSIDSKADGSTPTSTNFIPVVISQQNVSKPSMPTGGSYDYSTKTLTPPNGWVEGGTISTNTYISMGVANADTRAVKWSEPYNSLSIKGDKGEKGDKGDKGDTGSGGGTTEPANETIMVFAYKHSDVKPSKPEGASYNVDTNILTLGTDGWVNTASGLEKPVYMCIGVWRRKDNSIEWQEPFLAIGQVSDIQFDDVIQSDYATTYCYIKSDTVPETPIGGTYSFEKNVLTKAPTTPAVWSVDRKDMTPPLYMSIGYVERDKEGNVKPINWSSPILIANADGLGPGPTPGTDNLVVSHVVMCYQNNNSQPTAPESTEGSVNFTTKPYTVTPPSGWKLGDDDSITITDDTWVTIKAFYYKADDNGANIYETENSTRIWSTPVKHKDAMLSLSKEELDLVVGKMSITSNEIKTAVSNFLLEGDNLETMAHKLSFSTNSLKIIGGAVQLDADKLEVVANKIVENSNYRQEATFNAAGELVSAIKQDETGLMTMFSKNFVNVVKEDEKGEGGIIQLMVENSKGEVVAEIMTGKNDKGSYIKQLADNIDTSANSTITQTVQSAVNNTVSNTIQGDDYIKKMVKNLDAGAVAGQLIKEDMITQWVTGPKGLVSQITNSPDCINMIVSGPNGDGEGGLATKLHLTPDQATLIAQKINFESENFKLVTDKAAAKISEDFKLDVGGEFSTTFKNWVAKGKDISFETNKVSFGEKASSVFYADGSGYVANQAFDWDKDGTIHINSLESDGTVGYPVIQFNKDGSGYVAGSNIAWNKNGDVILKGEVYGSMKTSTMFVKQEWVTATTPNSIADLNSSKVNKSFLYITSPDSTTQKLYVRLPTSFNIENYSTIISLYIDYNVNSDMSPKSDTYLQVTDEGRVFSNCIFKWETNEYDGENNDFVRHTETRIAQLKTGNYHLENGFLYTFINVMGTWKLINQTLTINNTKPYYI